MTKQILLFLFLISASNTFSQKSLLQSGPMVGYAGYREALIWVQTVQEAKVKIEYWKKGDSSNRHSTKEILSERNNEFIVKLFPSQVDYGVTYEYQVYINKKAIELDYALTFQTLPLWQWRTDPPEINFAIGSCAFVNETKDDRNGKPYGGNYEIFNAIHEKKPDFMVWLGDNTYLREPDFLTKRGIMHRYTHTRSLPELQPLLGSVHHYAIWDDHDYGPNDSNRSYVNKHITEEAFNLFWGNPNTNATGLGGITGMFEWGDLAFFLLDNRYFRSNNLQKKTNNKVMLGYKQIEWLIDALMTSKAPFKFICVGGQMVNPEPIYENYAIFPEEKDFLLKRLDEEKIEGVVFLTGDIHHSEVTKMVRAQAYPLFEIICSPLTSGVYAAKDDGSIFREEGTIYNGRNFGVINVSGSRKKRVLELTIYDTKGEKVYSYTIKESELKYK